MEYADMEDNTSASVSNNRGYMMDHAPTVISDNLHVKKPQYIICSMEESMKRKYYSTHMFSP
eukprot:6024821-Ditylum_brightwellii.AAC.1